MWNRKRFKGNNSKLNMFLEAIEMETESDDPVKDQVIKLMKQGKTSDEIIEYFDNSDMNVDPDDLGRAIIQAKQESKEMPEEADNISDISQETNKIVQSTEENDEEDEDELENGEEDEMDEAVGDSLKNKASDLINMILKAQGVQNPEKKDVSLINRVAAVLANMTEEGSCSPEKQFSEIDYIINSASKVAEEFKLDESKVRDILADEMKHYKESDPTFKEDEFSNELANYSLKKKKK